MIEVGRPSNGRHMGRAGYSLLVWLAAAMAGGQTIFTVAGLPRNHRASVDGKPALSAPLNPVYGLLFDKLTGRLLLNDVQVVERLEPDGTLLALAGFFLKGRATT